MSSDIPTADADAQSCASPQESHVPFPPLEVGQVDPVFKKTVAFIILDSARFYIFLDPEHEIFWMWNAPEELKSTVGNILNRVAFLQSLARFAKEKDRKHFHRLIAEGLARYLDYASEKQANEALDIAEKEIKELSLKISWRWYFNAAYLLTAISSITLLLLWCFRQETRLLIGYKAFDVIFAALIGPIGALISVIARGDRITLDANAGILLHITEGLARIAVGMCGSGLVALAIKAGIIAGGVAFKGSPFATLLTFALVAGASERIVPSLIDRVERYAVRGETERKKK